MKHASILLLIFLMTIPRHADGSDPYERFPFRLPDWFWQAPDKAYLIPPVEMRVLQTDCQRLLVLKKISGPNADELEESIARRLSARFSLRDLAAGAEVCAGDSSGIALAVQLDPQFDEGAKATLRKGVSLFLDAALSADVIERALARSTATPSPMPDRYELKDGKPVIDEAGRPQFTTAYATYLKQRSKPASASAFTAQLREALSPANGDPAVLFISSYSGNAWWGGSYHGFFNSPIQQAGRESPPRGYLSIGLNSDKLTAPEPDWNDAAFWASKIAHEILHNLAYWHPAYKDPADRDANNHDNQWAFIVSYEAAIYDKLIKTH
jgi:hypothetical protein